jgi:predicted AAA+ superfamily ATPase
MLALDDVYREARFIGAVSSAAPGITTGGTSSEGRVSVFVLPALTFLEFLRFRGSEEKLFGTDAGKAGAPMVVSPSALKTLNDEFHRYVNSGGFPDGVLTEAGNAERVLQKDMASLAGVNDPRELNRLFATLAFNTGLEVTIEELAKTAGIAKNTLRKYLDYLEHAFLIRRLARVDRAAKRFQRARAFKVYLTSASLYAALFGPVEPEDEIFPRLAETALAAQWLGSDAAANLAYAGWKGGGIDLLSPVREPWAVSLSPWRRFHSMPTGLPATRHFAASTPRTEAGAYFPDFLPSRSRSALSLMKPSESRWSKTSSASKVAVSAE